MANANQGEHPLLSELLLVSMTFVLCIIDEWNKMESEIDDQIKALLFQNPSMFSSNSR